MVDGQSDARALAQVNLACGRILGSARSIVEAHRFGVPEGDHERPWTAAYMREAVSVYAEALPVWYQRAIASLYRQCTETMGVVSIPGALAEDWLIVRQHLVNASHAIEPYLAAQPEPAPSQRAASSEISDHEPVVVRVDRLAALTTSAGARRLEQAALAVQGEVGSGAAIRLDKEQMRLLRAVASGAAIAALAVEFSYSQRTMYRELSRLWKALGVPDRVQGIRRAATEGLLD